MTNGMAINGLIAECIVSKVTSDYEVILFSSRSLSDLSLPDIGKDFTWKKII